MISRQALLDRYWSQHGLRLLAGGVTLDGLRAALVTVSAGIDKGAAVHNNGATYVHAHFLWFCAHGEVHMCVQARVCAGLQSRPAGKQVLHLREGALGTKATPS